MHDRYPQLEKLSDIDRNDHKKWSAMASSR